MTKPPIQFGKAKMQMKVVTQDQAHGILKEAGQPLGLSSEKKGGGSTRANTSILKFFSSGASQMNENDRTALAFV